MYDIHIKAFQILFLLVYRVYSKGTIILIELIEE